MPTLNDPRSGKAVRVGMAAGMAWTPAHFVKGALSLDEARTGAYRLSVLSAAMSASFSAGANLFTFRYDSTLGYVCLIHGISVQAAFVTAPAAGVAAKNIELTGTVARSYTAQGTTGSTAVSFAQTQDAKLRTYFVSADVTAKITNGTTTTGIVNGTWALDSQPFATAEGGTYWNLAANDASRILVPKTQLLGDLAYAPAPLVLADDEGFVIKNKTAAPATMTWKIAVDVLWSEQASF